MSKSIKPPCPPVTVDGVAAALIMRGQARPPSLLADRAATPGGDGGDGGERRRLSAHERISAATASGWCASLTAACARSWRRGRPARRRPPRSIDERGYDAIPARGPFAALTVPGAIGGWMQALEAAKSLGGKMPLDVLLAPAIGQAREGYVVTRSQHG